MPYFLGDQVREPAGRLRDKIRHRIDDIARHGPRFLFRAHSPESGGSEKLNAPDVITTRATLNGTSPSSIHDVPVKQLARVVFSHLGWQDCNTLFSSWTQSLQVAVRIARNYSQHEGRQMWISIIDTKRLPSTNTMLYTPALGQVLGTQEMFSDEFLCYGTVAGGAIRSAPYSELEKHGINWLFPSNNLLSDPGKAFSIAVDIAKLFGDRFSLPVATYLLATHVAAMAILAEKPTHLPDTMPAIVCLRELVLKFQQTGTTSTNNRKRHTEDVDGSENESALRARQNGSKSKHYISQYEKQNLVIDMAFYGMGSDKPEPEPPEVKKLKIEMKG